MDPKPCPNCGASKHPLKACPQCGLLKLLQERMEGRSKAYLRDPLDTLYSELRKGISELQDIREWIRQTREAAKESLNEGERVQMEADLCALEIYETEVKNRLNNIKTEVREIQNKKAALIAYKMEVKSVEGTRIITSRFPAIPVKKTVFVSQKNAVLSVVSDIRSNQKTTHKQRSEAKKVPIKSKYRIQRNEQNRVSAQTHDFCWNCPVCHANFLSKETKNRHIRAHGIEAVAHAIAEQNKSANKQTIAIEGKNNSLENPVHTGRGVKAPNIPCVNSPNLTGACRICGKNKPMQGEDICFHCQSE